MESYQMPKDLGINGLEIYNMRVKTRDFSWKRTLSLSFLQQHALKTSKYKKQIGNYVVMFNPVFLFSLFSSTIDKSMTAIASHKEILRVFEKLFSHSFFFILSYVKQVFTLQNIINNNKNRKY